MKTSKIFTAAVFAVIALAAGIGIGTACSSRSTVTYPAPASFTVYDDATCYVGYQYDPAEVRMYPGIPAGCTAVAFPSISYVPPTGTLAFALATHMARYDSFYHSGYWYDQYYAPLAPRYGVHLSVTKNVFIDNSRTFEKTYASQIRTESQRATYVDAKGKTIKNSSSYSFPSSNSKAANRPLTNTNGKNANANSNTNSRSSSSSGSSSSNTKTFGGSAYSKPLSNTGSRSVGGRR